MRLAAKGGACEYYFIWERGGRNQVLLLAPLNLGEAGCQGGPMRVKFDMGMEPRLGKLPRGEPEHHILSGNGVAAFIGFT